MFKVFSHEVFHSPHLLLDGSVCLLTHVFPLSDGSVVVVVVVGFVVKVLTVVVVVVVVVL